MDNVYSKAAWDLVLTLMNKCGQLFLTFLGSLGTRVGVSEY